MSFTVVICAHTMDREASLRAAIESVQHQTLPASEIIVVCDHNPELKSLITDAFPTVTVIANYAAKGLSGARNTGLANSTGAIIAFIDDDATADPDWLSVLADAYVDSNVMAAGGNIAPIWPDERPSWFPPEFDWVIGCSYLGLPKAVGPVRNLIGCNMSMRRDYIESVGGFLTGLGRVGDNAAGCEETELFIRMQNQFPKHTILLTPQARVHHSIAPSRTRWRYFTDRCKAEGRAKAVITRAVGAQNALSTESNYIRRTLPGGVWRGLKDAARGDWSGLSRASAIVLGLVITSGSFTMERMKTSLGIAPSPKPFQPLLIVDADITKGLPDLSNINPETGEHYGAAWCLIRQSEQPMKILEVSFEQSAISSKKLEELVRSDAIPSAAPLPSTEGIDIPHVSVVIATKDRPESLRHCLDSLLAQTYSAMDIVIVDNAPTSSATSDLYSDVYAQTGRVRYIRENVPGLGRAHNTGAAASSGEVIAFTDDDVIVDHSWVASIAANFAHSSQIGCVTGLILPAELQTRAQYWTEQHGGFGKGFSRRVFDPETGHQNDPLFPYSAGSFGSGANMAFRRKTLEQMNGFDAALGAGTLARGGDDLAAFVAALQTGSHLVYEPGAMVWHYHRRSEEGMRRQAFNYGVGLGAYLTKQIVDDPKRLAFFARKFPAALKHLFSKKSSKMVRLPNDYPSRLVWSERMGILMGVPGYFRSRAKSRYNSSDETSSAPVRAHKL